MKFPLPLITYITLVTTTSYGCIVSMWWHSFAGQLHSITNDKLVVWINLHYVEENGGKRLVPFNPVCIVGS